MITSYFERDNFILYHGDSLRVLPQIPSESFDMIFADPPYRLSNGGFTVRSGKKVSVDKGEWDRSEGVTRDFDFHKIWISECRRLLKPNGTIWVTGTYHNIYECGYALQRAGYHILNDICWYKPKAADNLSGRFFKATHETLIWGRKNRTAKHKFSYDYLKRADWGGDFLKRQGEQMSSVWAIHAPGILERKFGKHPAQKPQELLRRVILSCTKRGDTILDPFCGSGTTGLVSYKYGRGFVGIESGKVFLDLTISRFEELEKNLISRERDETMSPPTVVLRHE